MGGALQAGIPASAGAATAIVAAGREELAALESRTAVEGRFRIAGARAVRGHLVEAPVVLLETGEGRDNAARSTRELLGRFAIRRLIVVGLAGGLSPALVPGTVLVAGSVWNESSPAPPPDPLLVEQVLHAGPVQQATLISSARMLCTREHKQGRWDRLRHSGPVLVDLETATIAAVAAEFAIPYVALRAVSDPAEESLPLDFNRMVDATGRIDRRKIVAHAALRPQLLTSLWRLRRRAALCSENLADVVCRALDGEDR